MIKMRVYKLEDNDLKTEVSYPTQAECQAYLDSLIARPGYWIKDERQVLDDQGNVIEVLPKTYRVEFEDVTAEANAKAAIEQNRKDAVPRLNAVKAKLEGATPLSAIEIKAILKDVLALLRVD